MAILRWGFDLMDRWTPLRYALKQKDKKGALEAIRSRVPHGLGESKTSLHSAIERGHTLFAIQRCLPLDKQQLQAILNFADADGMTPMLAAANMAHAEAIELLAKSGASLDVRDKYLRTPLYLALHFPTPAPKNKDVDFEKTLKAVKALVKWGVSLDVVVSDNQPLLQAYLKIGDMSLDPKIVAFLISEGAACPTQEQIHQSGTKLVKEINNALHQGLIERKGVVARELRDKLLPEIIPLVRSYIHPLLGLETVTTA